MDLGLGFEATVQLAATAEEREKVRLTWWAVMLIDRINSWGMRDLLHNTVLHTDPDYHRDWKAYCTC